MTAASNLFQLKIVLDHSEPRIWRRITVPSSATLGDLHHYIQAAMGWEDCHLHLFQLGAGAIYGVPDSDDWQEVHDEQLITLGEVLHKPRQKLNYEYDFGDSWRHTITLEKVLPLIGQPQAPECLAAQGTCPPEDIGGLHGYYNMLAALIDPDDPEREEYLTWLGTTDFDPEATDLKQINQALLVAHTARCQQSPATAPSPDADDSELLADIREQLAERGIESEEVAREILGRLQSIQEDAEEDFQGLSPGQIHALLYETFDHDWPSWSIPTAQAPDSPAVHLLKPLLSALQEGPVRTTPKGNLPLRLTTELIAVLSTKEWQYLYPYGWHRTIHPRSEDDCLPLQTVRILAEFAGLVETEGKRLALTTQGETLLREADWGTVWDKLARAALKQFNWAWLTNSDVMPGLQTTAPFMLWLLHRHGQSWRHGEDYALEYSDAFPMLDDELDTDDPISGLDLFEARLISLFLWLGLIEYRSEQKPGRLWANALDYEIRATDLFRAWVSFPDELH